MKRLKLALLGCGGRSYLALNHAHKPECGFELAAICDISRENMTQFRADSRQRYGTEPRVYENCREMIEAEKPDGVFVITPDYAHEQNACEILKTGTAVYLEKPLAISIESCDRILHCAKENRAGLMIGHNMRYMPFTRKMKEIIDSGAIGEVRAIWVRHFVNYGGDAYFMRWMCEQERVNSLLLQKGVHDIDIIHWLAGSYTTRAVGMGNLTVFDKLPRRQPGEAIPKAEGAVWPPATFTGLNPKIEANDHNMVLLQLANGVQASYEQCFYTPDACRNYTVIGTAGRLENYGDYCTENTTLEVWNQRHIERVFNMKGDISYDTTADLKQTHGGADEKIVADFCAYLRGEKLPDVTPQYSRYAVAAGCAGAESIRRNSNPVEVSPLPVEFETWDLIK